MILLRTNTSRQGNLFSHRESNHLPSECKSETSPLETSRLGPQKSEVRNSDQFEARYRLLDWLLLLTPLLIFSSIDLFRIDEAV
jgi:hypothetical protein